jgi:hypothetical protein
VKRRKWVRPSLRGVCGTVQGFMEHRLVGEWPCEACRNARLREARS